MILPPRGYCVRAQGRAVQQPADTAEHIVQHSPGKLSRVRVLTAGMIAGAQDGKAGAEIVEGPVREAHAPQVRATIFEHAPADIETDAAERQDDTHLGEQGEFPLEKRPAAGDLVGGGLISGWGAARGRGDVGPVESEAVVRTNGGGLAGEPGLVHGPDEPVARCVPGEHSAGAIRPVGRGS